MADIHLPAERWRYLVDVQLWPKKANFDPVGWISNFTPEEKPYALRLLEGFTFFSQELVPQMFRSAFVNLSKLVLSQKNDLQQAKTEWAHFLSNVTVVRVTGENPNDSDSGFAFSRYARDYLGIPEKNILSPEAALINFFLNPRGNLVFVDDFVGSGNQFIETWQRKYVIRQKLYSFEQIAAWGSGDIKFFYCPVICTEYGRNNIAPHCRQVQIVPAHFFDESQSTLTSNSAIWREDMQVEGPEFIKRASLQAGIPDLNGAVGCWRGFHKLGLALAFSHGWPDATLPLFYFNENNWKPLLRKIVL
jgi:hypothetical protein